MKPSQFSKAPFDLTAWSLWLIVIAGTLLRLLYPYFDNPISYLVEDTLRHYVHGFHMGTDVFSFLDPLGYQVWLTFWFKIIGTNHSLIALYAGILCALTPYIWYRWMLCCLPSKRAALVGYAVICLLPSWIAIYSMFMPETLLLPLMGLALWTSWIAKRKGTTVGYLLAAISWAAALATKLTAMPPLVVTSIWLMKDLFAAKKRLPAALTALLYGVIIAAAYLTSPLYACWGLGDFWLFPPGWARPNQVFSESGAESFTFSLTKHGERRLIGFAGKIGRAHV
jgi:hypothetical protein